MNSQILTPKHANPPVAGGSPRDGRHLIRPPATESTLKQGGHAPVSFLGRCRFDLGSNTRISAISTPKRTTVRGPGEPTPAATNATSEGFTKASTEPALLPCWLGLQSPVHVFSPARPAYIDRDARESGRDRPAIFHDGFGACDRCMSESVRWAAGSRLSLSRA